jgi:nitrogen fixation/metabolism regulation signal transduction histidine kinase
VSAARGLSAAHGWRHALSARVTLSTTVSAAAGSAAAVGAVAAGLSLAWAAGAGVAAVLLIAIPLARRALRPARLALRALHDGVAGFAESDFATRLASPTSDELGDLITLFNRMGDVLRRERSSLAQRELLLDTLLQGAPMAILLVNAGGRIVFANHAARRLLGGPARLSGETFATLIGGAPTGLQDALRRMDDSLVTWDDDGQEETWRVLVRPFTLHTAPHRLVVAERLTADLARQEAQVWKKAIRVLSHEVNNSLAPVSSLAHSAGVVAQRADAAERLPPILDAIAERVAQMTTFLEGYARFARLPAPQMETVEVGPFLERIRALFPFTSTQAGGDMRARFDPAQVQQVLINLLKNAEESGSPREAIALDVVDTADGVRFTVADRGQGMSDAQMRTALLPFHSTKRTGGGLGLSLCAEIVEAHRGRLRLARREGGGIAGSVWLPYSSSSSSGTG